MTPAAKPHAEPAKSELRRQQVLDAATECFRREGFHGSSIARISQAAGMSPGHIYHYFSNKEAIVEAIAEREEHAMADLMHQLEQDEGDEDLVTRLTRQTAQVLERHSRPEQVGLMLELAAEAARNPAVARILQRSDQEIDTQFFNMIRRLGMPPGLDEAELRLRMRVVAALFQGLAVRSQITPEIDRASLVRVVNTMIHALFGAPASDSASGRR